jgi:hypothetical protein
MSGGTPQSGPLTTEHSAGKPDKVADIPCTYYDVSKYEINRSTKAKECVWHADIWAAKNLGINPKLQKSCADMLQMPVELGFPLRITRQANDKEKALMKRMRSKNPVRDVIITKSMRHEKVDAGQFAKFDGFKPVKNEMELMMSDDAETLGGDLDDVDAK